MRAALMGMVLAISPHVVSAEVYSCVFPTVLSCESELAVLCTPNPLSQQIRLTTTGNAMPVVAKMLINAQWTALDYEASDFLDGGSFQVFSLGATEEETWTQIVTKASGAEMVFVRRTPALSYRKSGQCELLP